MPPIQSVKKKGMKIMSLTQFYWKKLALTYEIFPFYYGSPVLQTSKKEKIILKNRQAWKKGLLQIIWIKLKDIKEPCHSNQGLIVQGGRHVYGIIKIIKMTWDNDLSCMYYIGLVCTTVAWFNCRTLDDIYRPAGTGGARG